MYVLELDIARTRSLYPRPLVTLPDVLVIDVPDRFAHASLPLGRYYPIVIETERERLELERWVGEPRAGPVVPDLLDRRPSQLQTDQIVIATYDPPVPGWPFLLLCHWPHIYATLAGDPDHFARGAYTTEMFPTLDQLQAAAERILATLALDNAVNVTLLPHQAIAAGRA